MNYRKLRSGFSTSNETPPFDAVALFDLNAPRIKEVSAALEGMDLAQVTDSVTKFYRENPQWRDYHPALVIIGVLPRIRKGLSPVPPGGWRGE